MAKYLKSTLALTCLVVGSLATGGEVSAASIEFTNQNANINSEYSRTGAVNFIKQYAAKPGYTVSPFTTFGDPNLYGGGGDCTNFASQILHIGGGLKFHGDRGSNIFEQDWYYYGSQVAPATNPRTSSWTGAEYFRRHWGVRNGVGGKFAYQMRKYTNVEAANGSYQEIYDELWPGDIVQHVNSNGETTHTQIVWNYGSGTINVAEHSTDDVEWGLNIGLLTELKEREHNGGWVIILKIKKSNV